MEHSKSMPFFPIKSPFPETTWFLFWPTFGTTSSCAPIASNFYSYWSSRKVKLQTCKFHCHDVDISTICLAAKNVIYLSTCCMICLGLEPATPIEPTVSYIFLIETPRSQRTHVESMVSQCCVMSFSPRYQFHVVVLLTTKSERQLVPSHWCYSIVSGSLVFLFSR